MPLSAYRVVEIGDLPAASYAARLFADFGADVIRVEPPGGAATRAFPPMIDAGDGGRASGWFAWLNYGKRSVALDASSPDAVAGLRALVAGADVMIDSRPPAARGDVADDPSLVRVDLDWFGDSGPYKDFHATDSVCRALAGFVQLIGPVEGPPLTLPDYQSAVTGGLSAFIPAMAALHRRAAGGAGARIATSVHEATIALAEYQATEAWALGAPQKRWGFNRFTPTYPMGVYRCREGWIGITIVTPAQWVAFCGLMGMEDLARHPDMVMGPERLARADALEARFVPRFLDRTAAEWFASALELRLPFAIVPDMGGMLELPVFRERDAIVPITVGGRVVEAPGSPLRLTATPPRFGGAVPAVGVHSGAVAPRARAAPLSNTPAPEGAGALHGLRIVDLSMGWAGPICTRNLADLGADVIKVEACGYPDWWRGVDNRPAVVEQRLYEKSARFNVMNRGKRAITLDLTVPDGARLLKALVAGADAVIENYSSEVLPKLGLDYARLREVNPSLVMVSMAAFGATGAWRECRAYGSTLEQGSGLPSVGGRADDPPMMNHLAYGDAVGGLNAASAVLVALMHRRRAGVGQHVDLSQVQCMLPYAAAWAIERSANGVSSPRRGNRHPAFAPHGVFGCAGDDRWVLAAATDDAMWLRLCAVIGRDDLAGDPALRGVEGRRAQEDRIERAIGDWTRARTPDEAMDALQRGGVAAGAVRAPLDLIDDPHLRARGFWQWIDRAYVGSHPQPSAPYRFDAGPVRVRAPAATLGQHNAEILGGILGLSAAELDRLERDGVIGTAALPPARRKARAAAV